MLGAVGHHERASPARHEAARPRDGASRQRRDRGRRGRRRRRDTPGRRLARWRCHGRRGGTRRDEDDERARRAKPTSNARPDGAWPTAGMRRPRQCGGGHESTWETRGRALTLRRDELPYGRRVDSPSSLSPVRTARAAPTPCRARARLSRARAQTCRVALSARSLVYSRLRRRIRGLPRCACRVSTTPLRIPRGKNGQNLEGRAHALRPEASPPVAPPPHRQPARAQPGEDARAAANDIALGRSDGEAPRPSPRRSARSIGPPRRASFTRTTRRAARAG